MKKAFQYYIEPANDELGDLIDHAYELRSIEELVSDMESLLEYREHAPTSRDALYGMYMVCGDLIYRQRQRLGLSEAREKDFYAKAADIMADVPIPAENALEKAMKVRPF